MKTLSGVVGILLVSSISTFAIEGLQISVQSTNAVLSWPSMTNETFLTQYRQTLNATDSWLTLTNDLPAATNAATTTFSNSVAATTGFYRVVADGVHIYGLTNGMILSGTVQFPIELALDSTDQIAGISLNTDGSPLIGASVQTNAAGAWMLNWDTTMMPNGSVDVAAEVDFDSDDPVTNFPVAVTVSNVVSFPNYFSRVFGDQMWIYAQTIPDASYEIDIYDENTNYVGSFYDSADDNGVISFLWNLVDGDGIMHNDTNFLGVFTVDTSSPDILAKRQTKTIKAGTPHFQTAPLMKKTLSNKINVNGIHPDAGSSSANAIQFWVKEPRWTPNNNWVVAYGLFNASSPLQHYDEEMIYGGAGGEEGGALGALAAPDVNATVSPGNSAGITVFTLGDSTSRSNLLSYLASANPDYRNFYFFGHGSETAIGSYNGFDLTRDQIADALLNIPFSYQMQHAAEHPYRFVFIDACDTGKANFCEAFGIPAQTLSTNNFAAQGVESRAFVGFKSWNLNVDEFDWQDYSLMTGYFLGMWLSGETVQTCVGNAVHNTQSGLDMDSSAVIYGAYDMNRFTVTRP